MMRIETASRLHFGLLRVVGDDSGLAVPLSLRRFGGVGLMIKQPSLRLTLRPSSAWSAEGPLAERAVAFADRFTKALPFPASVEPQHIVVEHAPPEHAGLGVGTQLGMAVAHGLATKSRLTNMPPAMLAQLVGRGRRSAVGIHGFIHGGFLVEAGKLHATTHSPLVARHQFPREWRVVLVLLPGQQGLHGDAEMMAFHHVADAPGRTDALCRIIVMDLLPALVDGNVAAFGEALHEFNARAGEPFASTQRGIYSSPRVAEVVAFVRKQGVRGTGQSSWGPTVFAVVDGDESGKDLAARLRGQFGFGDAEIMVTEACNSGATIQNDEIG
jgi:beta-ribofuranosylaminobenzene 5'-phosphate synthase